VPPTGPAGNAGRDADAGADEDGLPWQLEGRLEPALDPPGHRHRIITVSDVGQQHGELVTTQAGQGVPVPQAAGQPLGDVAEELVACVVAEAVVDHLEVVQIDEEQADGLLPLPERVLQPVLEQGPVRQAGQRVVERLLGQPLLVQRPLGDVTVVEYQTTDGRVVKKVCDGHLEAPGRLPVPEGPHADLPMVGTPGRTWDRSNNSLAMSWSSRSMRSRNDRPMMSSVG
jgi:hypothetical protein